MMAKRISQYATMSASDLARVTRERGLTKPEGMMNISEWADWLEAEDAKEVAPAVQAPAQVKAKEDSGFVVNYYSFTPAQLKKLAKERNVDLQGATEKDDIIAALELADSEPDEGDDDTHG